MGDNSGDDNNDGDDNDDSDRGDSGPKSCNLGSEDGAKLSVFCGRIGRWGWGREDNWKLETRHD